MSNSYYYFVASLPTLVLDAKTPLTIDQFLEESERMLARKDYERLVTVLKGGDGVAESGGSVYAQWVEFDRNFRNDLVVYRAEKLKKDPSDFLRGDRNPMPGLVSILQASESESNLLETEKALDAFRWNFLEDLMVGHYFDFECVLIYGLKLKMLERYENVKSPRGSEIFEELKNVSMPVIGQ